MSRLAWRRWMYSTKSKLLRRCPKKLIDLPSTCRRLAEHSHVTSTRQRGLIGALELTPDKARGLPYPALERRGWQVCRATLANGVWLRPLGDVIYVMPPLAISLDELDEIMETLTAAINTVIAAQSSG